MSEDKVTAERFELTEGELAWPYADWKLYVGRLLELGGGLRMGLVRVPDRDSCVVQVFRPEAQPEAEMVTLRLDEPVSCKSRMVRLVEADATAPRPWVRVLVA